jgi:hypothetical protein
VCIKIIWKRLLLLFFPPREVFAMKKSNEVLFSPRVIFRAIQKVMQRVQYQGGRQSWSIPVPEKASEVPSRSKPAREEFCFA